MIMDNERLYDSMTSGAGVSDRSTNVMLSKVYWWMFGALTVTGLTALYVSNSMSMLQFIFADKWTFLILVAVELGLVIGLSAALDRISALTATLMFLLYSVINGMTLSSIFIIYDIASIARTFFVSAGIFAAMAVVGSITKRDLTKIGTVCIFAVIGLIVVTLINFFIGSTMLEMVVSGIGVVVFLGLTAYDSQKIKAMLHNAPENDATSKIAVYGALELYLDFINIFLYMLRFLGRRN